MAADRWTYDDVRRVVITALEIEGRGSVSLDVSRSDYANIADVISYAKTMGYDAEEKPMSESVLVTRHVDRGWIPGPPATGSHT